MTIIIALVLLAVGTIVTTTVITIIWAMQEANSRAPGNPDKHA